MKKMEKKMGNALKYVPIHWSDMNLFLGFRSKSRMEVPAVCHLWRGDTFVDSRPQVNWSKLTGKQLESWSTNFDELSNVYYDNLLISVCRHAPSNGASTASTMSSFLLWKFTFLVRLLAIVALSFTTHERYCNATFAALY